jgi:hypothetical protein
MPGPWPVPADAYDRCIGQTFPMWLKERGGIAIYENRMMDSTQYGTTAYLPASYIAEDNLMHPAPPWIGDMPSSRRELIGIVTLETAGGLENALANFVVQEEPKTEPETRRPSRKRDKPAWYRMY